MKHINDLTRASSGYSSSCEFYWRLNLDNVGGDESTHKSAIFFGIKFVALLGMRESTMHKRNIARLNQFIHK